jgi:hypothetical protein
MARHAIFDRWPGDSPTTWPAFFMRGGAGRHFAGRLMERKLDCVIRLKQLFSAWHDRWLWR